MATQFSSAIAERHIAPGISSFTAAEIPDMSNWAKESSHWIANFFLNSAFSASFKAPMNAFAFNFLRRAQFSFLEHQRARAATVGFLAGSRQSVSKYCEALHHWELFFGQAWHGYSILLKAFQGTAFKKGDGSLEERLNHFYNAMKHVESRIENAQILPEATVPVWLANDGLHSVDAVFGYAETGEVLKQIALWADALMDPRTAKGAFAKIDT